MGRAQKNTTDTNELARYVARRLRDLTNEDDVNAFSTKEEITNLVGDLVNEFIGAHKTKAWTKQNAGEFARVACEAVGDAYAQHLHWKQFGAALQFPHLAFGVFMEDGKKQIRREKRFCESEAEEEAYTQRIKRSRRDILTTVNEDPAMRRSLDECAKRAKQEESAVFDRLVPKLVKVFDKV